MAQQSPIKIVGGLLTKWDSTVDDFTAASVTAGSVIVDRTAATARRWGIIVSAAGNLVLQDQTATLDVLTIAHAASSFSRCLQANNSGSAGAPPWSFAGDGNTGMLNPASDQLGFSAGGVERTRVSAPAGGGTAGGRTQYRGLNASSSSQAASAVDGILTNITAGSETGALVILTANAGGALTERARVTGPGDLGLGTNSPNTKLDVNGDLAVRPVSPATLAAGDVDNYAGAADRSWARLTPDAGGTTRVTGFTDGHDGKILIVLNVGTATLTIVHQGVGSTDTNRIITATGANVAMAADDAMILGYDATTARWRQITTLA